ncbi:MAG: HD family phosphohydrolase [Candidatus Riflebacteria bacterium HGW-Riflebacteria-1]|jgi:putative nucleotidyltransferase with HDIG domain|nr:MAG: HD family phosphohydrolase [Candidatus Riflebacteria bacterium HGW-Riflebacteria-1]
MHGTDCSNAAARPISPEDLKYFKDWFDAYVETFVSDDPEVKMNIDLKYQHTQRVCRAAVEIATDLGLVGPDLWLAETAALFHDVGRFEQFWRYRTFSDKRSVNHAAFGVGILRGKDILLRLNESERILIFKSIALHNQAVLSDALDSRSILHARLLRDADKLDIWWVATDYYQQRTSGKINAGLELHLPDSPGISPEVYTSIMNGETVLFEDLKTLNDFKLLQTGWVYDINFAPTLRRLRERGYLNVLQAFLPDCTEVKNVFASVNSYIDKRLQSL